MAGFQVMAKDLILKSFAIRGMFAVDLGESAVIKFERRQDATNKGQPASGEFFVVDVWKKEGDSWKLANRFVTGPTRPRYLRDRPNRREAVASSYDRFASSSRVRSRSASSRAASVTT